MLKLKSISKYYGKKQVLNNVSFELYKGECIAIAGKNSVGKTTLLKICADRIKKYQGIVTAEGTVSFVPQYDELLQGLTVLDHISLWYSGCNKDKKEIFSKESFEYKLGLEDFKKMQVEKLSGGRAQRLSIALALISNPQIIIMDEPFASLDIVSREEVADILIDIKAMGKSMVISSHIIGHTPNLWDRVLVLDGGKIVKEIDQANLKLSSEELEKSVVNSFK